MVAGSKIPFSEFPFELVDQIAKYILLKYRPGTLLSLALLSHHLHDIVVPRLLYGNVCLRGDITIATAF